MPDKDHGTMGTIDGPGHLDVPTTLPTDPVGHLGTIDVPKNPDKTDPTSDIDAGGGPKGG